MSKKKTKKKESLSKGGGSGMTRFFEKNTTRMGGDFSQNP
jgi:hypothetical protein